MILTSEMRGTKEKHFRLDISTDFYGDIDDYIARLLEAKSQVPAEAYDVMLSVDGEISYDIPYAEVSLTWKMPPTPEDIAEVQRNQQQEVEQRKLRVKAMAADLGLIVKEE